MDFLGRRLGLVLPRFTPVVLAVAALASGGCAGSGAQPSAPGAPAEELRGHPPDFELETLGGEPERLSDHLGKEVVLLDFWATYCEPCKASMPHIEALYTKYHSQGLAVLGISIDGPDSVAQVRQEVQKLGVTFPILLDQETRVVALYNPKTSAPYSVLIGRHGTVLAKREGYAGEEAAAALEADIKSALDAK